MRIVQGKRRMRFAVFGLLVSVDCLGVCIFMAVINGVEKGDDDVMMNIYPLVINYGNNFFCICNF